MIRQKDKGWKGIKDVCERMVQLSVKPMESRLYREKEL